MDTLKATTAFKNVPCNTDELIANFAILIKTIDFSEHLKTLGINRLHIKKRSFALQHMQALTIGLWKLALQRSFPSDHTHIFEKYLTKRREQALNNKEQVKLLHFQLTIREYVELLNTWGDSNFTEISSHLMEKLSVSITNYRVARLKLALSIRNIYNTIFQKLI